MFSDTERLCRYIQICQMYSPVIQDALVYKDKKKLLVETYGIHHIGLLMMTRHPKWTLFLKSWEKEFDLIDDDVENGNWETAMSRARRFESVIELSFKAACECVLFPEEFEALIQFSETCDAPAEIVRARKFKKNGEEAM